METYGDIKARDRTQELELIAFTRVTGEEIEDILGQIDKERDTTLLEEYRELVWGE